MMERELLGEEFKERSERASTEPPPSIPKAKSPESIHDDTPDHQDGTGFSKTVRWVTYMDNKRPLYKTYTEVDAKSRAATMKGCKRAVGGPSRWLHRHNFNEETLPFETQRTDVAPGRYNPSFKSGDRHVPQTDITLGCESKNMKKENATAVDKLIKTFSGVDAEERWIALMRGKRQDEFFSDTLPSDAKCSMCGEGTTSYCYKCLAWICTSQTCSLDAPRGAKPIKVERICLDCDRKRHTKNQEMFTLEKGCQYPRFPSGRKRHRHPPGWVNETCSRSIVQVLVSAHAVHLIASPMTAPHSKQVPFVFCLYSVWPLVTDINPNRIHTMMAPPLPIFTVNALFDCDFCICEKCAMYVDLPFHQPEGFEMLDAPWPGFELQAGPECSRSVTPPTAGKKSRQGVKRSVENDTDVTEQPFRKSAKTTTSGSTAKSGRGSKQSSPAKKTARTPSKPALNKTKRASAASTRVSSAKRQQRITAGKRARTTKPHQ
eukprot:gene25688-1723_t